MTVRFQRRDRAVAHIRTERKAMIVRVDAALARVSDQLFCRRWAALFRMFRLSSFSREFPPRRTGRLARRQHRHPTRGRLVKFVPWKGRIPRAPRQRALQDRWRVTRRVGQICGLVAALLAGSCSSLHVDPFPEPIRDPKPIVPVDGDETAADEDGGDESNGLRLSPTPGVVIQKTIAEGIADRLGQNLRGEPIRVSFHDVPLIAFVNEVFGELLGMSFSISPTLNEKTDLVTLRLTEPVPPSQLFSTARRVLQDYGISIGEQEGVLSFEATEEIGSDDIPLLISGRALPEVPPTHRTIFQFVTLKILRTVQITRWLKQIFTGGDLGITEDPERNSLLLKGDLATIAQAIEMIGVLDQPALRGRNGVIIEPQFLEASVLAKDITTLMDAQGFKVGGSGGFTSTMLIPLESVNKLVVFSVDAQVLGHVEEWARTLDAEQQQTIEDAVFTYQVLHTQAEEMTETLNGILGIATGGGGSDAAGSSAAGGSEERTQRSSGGRSGRIVVDKNRNMLLFRGSGKEWGDLLTVIEELDKPVPSVLIEVMVAEVTLTDEDKSGLEFLLRGTLGNGRGIRGGTLGSLGLQDKALSLTLDSAGQTRAMLNAFYDDSRVMIRSRPRLLVKSGETATLEAGNEIPVVVQSSDSDTQLEGSTNILQQVSYRKTGVILEIEPIVQANGLVDLSISQELSEARPTAATSLEGTPTILNRRISTSLTLRDGGSLVMGGLISNSQSSGQAGIPGVGRIPVLGRLFRSDSYNEDRTELVIMVIPYVVANFEEGRELTERIKEELELHEEYMRLDAGS